MSIDGLFPGVAARVNRGGTPTVTLLWGTLVAVLFIGLASVDTGRGSAFERVVAVTAFFFVVNYVVAYLSFFVLRRREPGTTRPYRAWGYPWTAGLALIGSLAFLIAAIASDTTNSLWAIAVLAASYPVYRLMRRRINLSDSSA